MSLDPVTLPLNEVREAQCHSGVPHEHIKLETPVLCAQKQMPLLKDAPGLLVAAYIEFWNKKAELLAASRGFQRASQGPCPIRNMFNTANFRHC